MIASISYDCIRVGKGTWLDAAATGANGEASDVAFSSGSEAGVGDASHFWIAGSAARAACSPKWIIFFALANESHDMSATEGAMTTFEYRRQLF